MSVGLPAGIHVVERGWLSANNIVLFDGEDASLVDTGYVSHADQTVALVRAVLDGRSLTRLFNTHSHSDHIGGNAAVHRAFGCRIHVPDGMADAVERWDEDALLLTVADQHGERFPVHERLVAGERFVAGGGEWSMLAAPGHDMDALMFHDADRRILISGDALWRDGFGILFAEVLGHGGGLEATRQTLEAIGRLSVDWVIPGHGEPFAEFDEALASAFGRLAAFEQDGARMARNAIRACITFSLLERRRMTLDALADQLAHTPLYRESNIRFLGWPVDRLTTWVVDELQRAGVAKRQGDALVAC